jgi:iron(III) transport system permease protein
MALWVIVPLGFLVAQAFLTEGTHFSETLWNASTAELLFNTLILMVGVLMLTMVLAFPLAWLTTRTNLPLKRLFTLLCVLPLAMPGYVMAYSLLAFGGNYGAFAQSFGVVIPRLSGYFGALIALGFYLYPYMYLNLRAAILGLDPALEESARSLGLDAKRTFLRVVLPQLRPAFYASALLIVLHVLGDFGVVSLMRYKTFSFALYMAHNGFNRAGSAWLALLLLVLTLGLLLLEARLLKGLRLDSQARGKRKARLHEIGYWKWIGVAFGVLVTFGTFAAPLFSILYWLVKRYDVQAWTDLPTALISSASVAFPTAFLAAFLAIVPAYLMLRYPSKYSATIGRIGYLGYALPPLALALAMIFLCLKATPFLYQTYFVLIFAYVIHFLAEALSPVRSALYQAPARLEEVARSLGYTRFQAFLRATLPLLKRGLLTAIALVFLSVMKELPLTFLLAPIGFETLAMNVWSYTNNANFGASAPFALTIVVFSAAFVGLVLTEQKLKE